MIKITIPGEPRALQRHRTAVIKGRQKQYDPQAKQKVVTRNYMLAERMKQNWPYMLEQDAHILTSDHADGFDLTINFYCYRPPILRMIPEDEFFRYTHTRKPDLDNMIKYILDCGNKILWHDDAEIYKITASKCWSKTPRTEILCEFVS